MRCVAPKGAGTGGAGSASPRRWRQALVKVVKRRDRAASILEFALVAMPVVFLLFATIELGLIFATNINLANSVSALARQVRLGSVILPGMAATTSSGTKMDLADFKQTICAKVAFLTPAGCLSALQVDVRVLSSFGAAAPNPISGNTFSSGAFCFYSGSPGNVVQIRTYLLWSVATPVLLSSLSQIKSVVASGGNSSGDFFVLMADEAFVNEPNGTVTNTGSGC